MQNKPEQKLSDPSAEEEYMQVLKGFFNFNCWKFDGSNSYNIRPCLPPLRALLPSQGPCCYSYLYSYY